MLLEINAEHREITNGEAVALILRARHEGPRLVVSIPFKSKNDI
jgi:hypothetical protein